MRARLAVFLPALCYGGVERGMLNLGTGLAARGHEVDLVAASAAGELRPQVPQSVRVVDLRASRVLFSLPGLGRYLRRERPVALISAMDHANVVAVWARKIAAVGTQVVATVHCLPSAEARAARRVRGKMSPYFVRGFYRWANHVVAVSHALADDLARTCGVPRERIQVIPNPVITPEFLDKAKEPVAHPWFGAGQPPVVLGVGRLVPQKGFDTLIRAFAQARQRLGARLVILGEGPERGRLETLVRELGLAGTVELAGYAADPYAYMGRAALLVLPSEHESFGLVLIEALAAGTRVVASDTPGAREVLANGKYGRLTPVGDVAALASAMAAAISEPAVPPPAEMLRPYTLEAVTDAYLGLLGLADAVPDPKGNRVGPFASLRAGSSLARPKAGRASSG